METARAAGLPLVQLHREVPFVAVTEEIHTEIVNGHYALLQRAEEVHRRCTEALLSGGGIPQVLRHPGRLQRQPGVPGDDRRPAPVRGRRGPEGADPLQVWEGLRGHAEGRAAGRPVLVDVPGGGQGAGSVRARLVLLPVSARLPPVHRIAAERAAGILAVVLMQARQEEELAARGRGDFLTDLAEGRIDAEDAPAQARVLGLQARRRPLLPVVMRLGDGPRPRAGGWAVLARAVAEELSSVGVPVLLGVRPVEGRVPLLVGLRAEPERPAVADRVAAALRAGVERAGMERAGRPAAGRSSWASRAAGRRPRRACATRRRRRRRRQGLPDRPWYDARRLDIDLLLWRLRDHPDLAAFVDRAIGPLRTHDRPLQARRCCPRWRPTWRTRAARRKRPANSTSTARPSTTASPASGSCWARDLDDPQTVLALSLALRARRHVS